MSFDPLEIMSKLLNNLRKYGQRRTNQFCKRLTNATFNQWYLAARRRSCVTEKSKSTFRSFYHAIPHKMDK